MGSSEGSYLAIPTRGEILAEALEPGELAQRMKMFGKPRVRVIDSGVFYELAPGLVREESERAELTAVFEMTQDFGGNALLIFQRRMARDFRAEFDKGFLCVGSLSMNAAHKADQLVPRLAVDVSIFSGVNSGQLPFVFSGKRLDRM